VLALLAAGAGPAWAAASSDAAAGKSSAVAPAPPPAPPIPPPIASHADPTLPVPTNPPERIAPPAKLSTGTPEHGASGGTK
jgi:hypothetical protein